MKSFRFSKIWLTAVLAVTVFIPKVQAQDRSSWQGMLPTLLLGVMVGSNFSTVLNKYSEAYQAQAARLGCKPALPEWAKYTHQCLTNLRDPNACSTPVYDFPTSAESDSDTTPLGQCRQSAIWLNSAQYNNPTSQDLMKHTCAHEAVHKAKGHEKTIAWSHAVIAAVGSGLGGFVMQSIAGSIANKVVPKEYQNLQPLIRTAAIIPGNYMGMRVGHNLFTEYVAAPLTRYQEKEADIIGARISGAVSAANCFADRSSGEGLDEMVRRPTLYHGSSLERYTWFKELAEKEGKGHLVKPITVPATVGGMRVTYTIDPKKFLKNKEKATREMHNTLYQYGAERGWIGHGVEKGWIDQE